MGVATEMKETPLEKWEREAKARGFVPTIIKQSDRFYIKQFVGEARARFVEVPQAKAVKLKGYENYDFFISRTVDESGKPLERGLWQIYEGKTGLIAGQSATTQKEAIANSINALNARTEELDEIIKYGIEHEGLSPRYRKE